MSSELERFEAEMQRRQTVGETLRGQMVRAQSWDQLFVSPEDALADYLTLVHSSRDELQESGNLAEYKVEPHPDGDIHRMVYTSTGDSTYQRLADGNAVMTFYRVGKPADVNLITPSIGNINHPFTVANTVMPDIEILIKLSRGKVAKELQETIGTTPDVLAMYLTGKPACQGWEDTMLANAHMPQRIGYRIVPTFALEGQVKFAALYPDLMPKQQ